MYNLEILSDEISTCAAFSRINTALSDGRQGKLSGAYAKRRNNYICLN